MKTCWNLRFFANSNTKFKIGFTFNTCFCRDTIAIFVATKSEFTNWSPDNFPYALKTSVLNYYHLWRLSISALSQKKSKYWKNCPSVFSGVALFWSQKTIFIYLLPKTCARMSTLRNKAPANPLFEKKWDFFFSIEQKWYKRITANFGWY